MKDLISSLIVIISVLINIMILTIGERKMMGSIQRRVGPSTIGYMGLGQGISDGLKLYIKTGIERRGEYLRREIIIYILMLSLSCWLVIPFCYGSVIMNLEWSLWYILIISGISVFGILIGGNAGESMYGKVGGIRGIIQIISNEIYIGMIWMSVILICGSINLCCLNGYQIGHKNVEILWIILSVIMINILGELQRGPTDISEGESELISGYNIEFGGLWFAGYFIGEYSNIILESYIIAIMLGLGLKTGLLVMFIIIWVRCVFPRIRMDKIIKIGWTKILPIIISYYILVLLTVKLIDGFR